MQRLLHTSFVLAVCFPADVNKDGNEDVFFGGASGHRALIGTGSGTFVKSPSQPWGQDACEDMGSVFLMQMVTEMMTSTLLVEVVICAGPAYQDRLYVVAAQNIH
jgi:hypothetical protein